MAPASTAAVLLLDLPPGILCGIDLLSFTTTAHFQGIKDVPRGCWHFVFTSETASHSIRDGFWFHVPTTITNSPPLIVRKWDTSLGSLLPCSDPDSFRVRLPSLWEKNLSPYRQSAGKEAQVEIGDWAGLTEHLSPRLIRHLTQNDDWKITSASSAKEDRDEIPGLTAEDVKEEEMELGVLGIDLKRTWREGAIGRERTEAALDSRYVLFRVEFSCLVLILSHETCFGSRRTFLLPGPILQLHLLHRKSNTNSEICVAGR